MRPNRTPRAAMAASRAARRLLPRLGRVRCPGERGEETSEGASVPVRHNDRDRQGVVSPYYTSPFHFDAAQLRIQWRIVSAARLSQERGG